MPKLAEDVPHYIGVRWAVRATAFGPVHNPARRAVIGRTPMANRTEVDAAVRAASKAFPAWSEGAPVVRARESFVGVLKVQGRDAFQGYTDGKVTISRWY